jgi:signal transduction histidine kinase
MRVGVVAQEVIDALPDEYKTCIYRVVQEALNNCARHAKATSAQINVALRGSAVILSIEDNGHGFDTHRTRGLGLVGMEERVHNLSGTFEVHSEPGLGTVVAIELPLIGNELLLKESIV